MKKINFVELVKITILIASTISTIIMLIPLRYKIEFDDFFNLISMVSGALLTLVLYKIIYGNPYSKNSKNTREKTTEAASTEAASTEAASTEAADNIITQFLIQRYINESKSISERMNKRSDTYLFLGCVTAFIGFFIIISAMFRTKSLSSDLIQIILDYLPKFGALFFIEFIAFFFFKQSRMMIEEYRYYEAIKRKRQDNLCLMELVEKYQDKPELLKDLIKIIKQDAVSKLQSGESTENLEVQKLLSQEMDLLPKITELIKAVKTK